MSGTPKFTPGPWRWWTSNSWRRLTAHNRPGGQYIREGDVLCPITASDGHPDLIVTEANMALMAAGPELYEACQIALQYWYADHPNDTVQGFEARAKIEAAIAKAEART